MKNLLYIIVVIVAQVSFGQQQNILIKHGKLHIGNGNVIESALIGIKEGEITLVKNSLAYSFDEAEWDTIIDASGKEIYPGFVASNSTLGITEIDAVRASRDFDETGLFNPHVRSLIAFNVESVVVSTVRTNGVLMAQSTPRGGIISGASSVLHLDGWNWEDAVTNMDDGIHLNWPATLSGGGWWANPQPKKANEKYGEQLERIKTFFRAASAYSKTKKSDEIDLRFEAMREIFNGEKRVYVHASELKALLDILDFAKELEIKFPVIVGGYDAYLIASQLKDAKIPVMLQRPHSLPENEGDDVDLPYKLPKLLMDGGVKFCIQNEGDMEAMNARNIPFLAGTARTYGLSEEEAISAVSLWPCEIMGMDKSYGSVEEGKVATLFISDGDALDMMSNNVSTAIVGGSFMSLTNRQRELYLKYKEKYEKEN